MAATLTLTGCLSLDYNANSNDVRVVEVPVYIEDTGHAHEHDTAVDTSPPEDTAIEEEVLYAVWVDSADQPMAFNGVDIIWIIDSSGSMGSYQTQVELGIEAMMNALPIDVDWRLVIISADPEVAAQNEWSTFPGYLTPFDTLADAQDMFNESNVGSDEEGFDAFKYYVEQNPHASQWMRDDTALLVVFVSDEAEQSDDIRTADEFVTYAQGVRNDLFIASIVNLNPAMSLCNSNASNEGEEYIDAANLVGGTVIDICEEDWSAGVQDAASQVEVLEFIDLTYVPDPASIIVYYDAVEVTEGGEWEYDASLNRVNFLVLPGEGVHVEIGYVYAI